jgi:hypothetical protein
VTKIALQRVQDEVEEVVGALGRGRLAPASRGPTSTRTFLDGEPALLERTRARPLEH